MRGGLDAPLEGDGAGEDARGVVGDAGLAQRTAVAGDAALDHAVGTDDAGGKRDAGVALVDKVAGGGAGGRLVVDAEVVELGVVDVAVDEERRNVEGADLVEQGLAIDAEDDQRIDVPVAEGIEVRIGAADARQHHVVAGGAEGAFDARQHLGVERIVEQQLILVFGEGDDDPDHLAGVGDEAPGAHVGPVVEHLHGGHDALHRLVGRLGAAAVEHVGNGHGRDIRPRRDILDGGSGHDSSLWFCVKPRSP